MAIGIQRFGTVLSKMDNDGNDTERNNGQNVDSVANKRMDTLPENLKLNGRTPSGKPRLFVCQTCTRAFARQEHLTRHERSHTKEKPYCCGICSRKFSRRDLLLRHAHKIHVDNYDDSIVRQNKEKNNNSNVSSSNSRITKGGRSRSAKSSSGSVRGMSTLGLPSSASTTVRNRRRASYSAQSEKYVPPSQSEQWNKAQIVKFSTPDVFPMRSLDDTFSYDDDSNNNNDNRNNGFLENTGSLDLGTHLGFNALDTNGWIDGYNDNGTSNKSWNKLPNSMHFEKFMHSSNNDRDVETVDDCYFGNDNKLRESQSPWTINGEDRELLVNVQSLFGNRNNSAPLTRSISEVPDSKSSYKLTGTSTGTRSSVPSSCLFDNENTNVDPRSLSQQINHSQLDQNSAGNSSNFAEDMQPIFSRFVQDEQSCDVYSIPQYLPTSSGNDDEILVNTSTGSLDQNLKSTHDNYTFNGLDFLAASNITKSSSSNNLNSDDFPSTKLFSPELRQMCLHSLEYYRKCHNNGERIFLNSDPILLSKDLVVPSCNELNEYLTYFQKYFNPHGAFIHPDLFQLDLSSLKNYVDEGAINVEEDFEFFRYSNLVCLPLYAATIGSLFKTGYYPKSMELYEISRCVLYVYLEKRKQQTSKIPRDETNLEEHQPVWLIQSLTLSITFALFADYLERMDSKMIIRQVGSICSITTGTFLKCISTNSYPHEFSFGCKESLNFNNSYDYIIFESKIRCTLMIYKICQFLKIFYHIESDLFLNENNLNSMFIPDDEASWINSSLLAPVPNKTMGKKYTVGFQRFYHSFTFNNIGMHSIPECLSSAMLYYEYNASNLSTFQVFLTKNDTKKLEINQEQPSQSDLKLVVGCHNILNSDAIFLRNCLMSMTFLTKINFPFGCNKMSQLFNSFLDPTSVNILRKGSYNLLTDFLVALNFSIKNVAHFLTGNNYARELDKTKLSLFNCQGLYFNFLILIKFILDYERTPNFKLLCIITELKKLADSLLIPKYSELYPMEFTKFLDVSTTNKYLQHCPTSGVSSQFSKINADGFEKLINNVLVHAFNDVTLLNVSEQSTTEYSFNKNHPNYYSHTSPEAIAFDYEEMSFKNAYSPIHNENDLFSFQAPTNMSIYQDSDNSNGNVGNDSIVNDDFYMKVTSNDNESGLSKEKLVERYQLSDEYIIIAKCFFAHIRDAYAHCHIFEKLVADFQELEECLSDRKDTS